MTTLLAVPEGNCSTHDETQQANNESRRSADAEGAQHRPVGAEEQERGRLADGRRCWLHWTTSAPAATAP